MKTMDKVLGWLLIAFGLVHLALTGKAHPQLGIDAIWFASGGLFMMMIGALNLLRVAYTSMARGVHAVSVIGNFMLLLLIVVIAIHVPMRSNPQVLVGLALAGLLTAFSIFRRVPQVQAQAGK